ncbi:ferrous iron transport protein B [Sanguibacter gelidistatuariae]|uniref:Ferrous iron transport protein B n=1 Tax=Sanguibacter gelidistatuariae TaxID=1814289 RepID=A0A1G6TR52_9MICO|nr:ferrous iron transport protein B [Sanguibacter gelidistatuariae]SDD31550.1 ferrous iron transport protein B [Sanguibacter gelidistatuariae]
MSCPHCPAGPTPGTDPGAGGAGGVGQAVLALVGTPNVGKSTLFAALTGVRATVRNAPGTTVDLAAGSWQVRGAGSPRVQLLDLPGTYSLVPRSPDEQVTRDAVAGTHRRPPDAIVLLVDAHEPARSLYLAAHVARTGLPVVVALTLADVARSRGAGIDPAALEAVLQVPVVELNPRTGSGVPALHRAVGLVLTRPRTLVGPAGAEADWSPEALTTSADAIFDWVHAVIEATAILDAESGVESGVESATAGGGRPASRTPARRGRANDAPAGTRPVRATPLTERLDRVLLHPLWGSLVALGVLWGLFSVATAVAAPLMAWADALFSGPVAVAISTVLGWAGWGGGWLESLLVGGLLVGVATVASFAPLMGLMFLAIAVLDDSGYLARVTLITDRAMRRLGLDGRAVLALVVGFGCNVPALAATKTLPDRRQRLLVGLLIPYTSCAARLTVFVLLATVFFPGHATLVVLVMYAASVALVVVAGLVLRATLFRDVHADPLVIVLPTYQRPRLRSLLGAAWVRTWGFVTGAGTIIVATLVVVWALLAIPVHGDHPLGDVPVQDSVYGATAQALAPAFAPAGFGDWHATSALMTGFVAKEVVIGGLAQSYAVAEPDPEATSSALGENLLATFDRSSGGHGQAAAAAFMVFILAYTPCLATVAEQARMLGRRTTALAVLAQVAVAWVLAVAVFQVGTLL